jgi:hypothetical protein
MMISWGVNSPFDLKETKPVEEHTPETIKAQAIEASKSMIPVLQASGQKREREEQEDVKSFFD